MSAGPADVRLLHLSDAATVLLDMVAWGVFHSATGYAAHRLPLRRLERDGWLLRPRRTEAGGQIYVQLGIRRWKDALPEAGATFRGGMSKRRLPPPASGGLRRFAAETRRAELAHWAAMACGPLFALWNPAPVAVVMVVYGVAINAPFIAIQRYNRLRVDRLLERSRRRSSSPDGPTR